MDHWGEGLVKVRLLTESFRMEVEGSVRRFSKGEMLDVAPEVGERLVRLNAAEMVMDSGPAPAVEPDPAPAVDASEPVTEPVEETRKRPLKSGGIAAWREYAAGLGIDTKGLTRPQIIAAVNKAEK